MLKVWQISAEEAAQRGFPVSPEVTAFIAVMCPHLRAIFCSGIVTPSSVSVLDMRTGEQVAGGPLPTPSLLAMKRVAVGQWASRFQACGCGERWWMRNGPVLATAVEGEAIEAALYPQSPEQRVRYGAE